MPPDRTPSTPTPISPASRWCIAEAGSLLREGQLVAFPTETVYGLGANALDDRAIAKVFAVKGRPVFNPLIVHVAGITQAERHAVFNPLATRLAKAFWPGGLTLVLPRRPDCALSLLVSAGMDTVALRAPAHPTAQALLEAAGVPIAAPSANRSGRVSATSPEAVAEELDGDVAMILDAGPSAIGLESTIIGFSDGAPVLLRPGAISRANIEAVVGPLGRPPSFDVLAPGMLASHYAPRAHLRLNVDSIQVGEALLAFGACLPGDVVAYSNLSQTADLCEAAANLFAMMRHLDKSGAATIAVMPIPEVGLGEAINDRLRRAAAPRVL